MRLFSFPAGKNVSTILPPPALTPLQRIDSVTVNPNDNVVYVLLCKSEIWIYGARYQTFLSVSCICYFTCNLRYFLFYYLNNIQVSN